MAEPVSGIKGAQGVRTTGAHAARHAQAAPPAYATRFAQPEPWSAWDSRPPAEPADQAEPAVKAKKARNAVDAWMDEEVTIWGRTVKRQRVALLLIGSPALIPLLFMSRSIIALNTNTMNISVADVMGSGSELCLLLALTVTPMNTVTRQRWFVPLRQWFGIMMAVTAITDASIAALTTDFAGGVVGRLAGHTFLLTGFVMVMIAIPLLAIANNRAKRWLGKYWKPLQRMTYVIWGLLFIHLALLFGFGIGEGETDDGDPFFHTRVIQLALCSLPLLLLRLPPVRRWVVAQQKDGRQWLVYTVCVPLALMYLLGFVFIANEEIFKGMAAFSLHPAAD